jgi:hypothetical protein
MCSAQYALVLYNIQAVFHFIQMKYMPSLCIVKRGIIIATADRQLGLRFTVQFGVVVWSTIPYHTTDGGGTR